MNTKRQDQAVATAVAYHQGNIAGLDDGMTRRLVASTVYTESSGGSLSITNREGYTGRYQAGAQWLADAGYVNREKLEKALGKSSEWHWATQGGMSRFLKDPSNWNDGLSLEKYKASSDLQDQAFKRICDSAYRHGIKEGLLHADDDPRVVAGFLKARHISGYGGAREVIHRGEERKDSNKTSNYTYYNDVAANHDGLDAPMRMSRAVVEPAVPGTAHRKVGHHTAQASQVSQASHHPTQVSHSHATLHDAARPSHAQSRPQHPALLERGSHGVDVEHLQATLNTLGVRDRRGHALEVDGNFGRRTHEAVEKFQKASGLAVDGAVGKDTHDALAKAERGLVSHPDHPHHPLFKQSLAGVHRTECERGIAPGAHSEHVAGAVTVQAVRDGLQRVDRVELNESGSLVRGVQVGTRDEPGLNRATQPMETSQAVQQSVAESSRQLQDAEQRRQTQVEQQHMHLSRPTVAGMQGLAPAM